MHDFTKEELEELNAMLHRHMHDAIDKRRANILHNKIQSMIDNYCEHDWDNHCCGCDPANIICSKCNKDVYGRQYL